MEQIDYKRAEYMEQIDYKRADFYIAHTQCASKTCISC